MGKLTFTNVKVSGAIAGEDQRFRAVINTAGACSVEDLAEQVAKDLKEPTAYVLSILRQTCAAVAERVGRGERVLLDDLCHVELEALGAFPTEDTGWDSERNAIVARAIPYDTVKFAAKDLVPENTLKPVAIQLLGAQDETTYEQNAVVKGHTLLLQGKNLRITAANADEGVYVVADDGTAHKLAVTASTAGTVDATVPEAVPAGAYTLEVRGRNGNGTNRMLVTARIAGFTVRAA